METGTLKELNVKPGDLVEYTFGHKTEPVGYTVTENWIENAFSWEEAGRPYWRIISRASDPETPKLWRYMTPEEKGALLLAHHEGGVIEYWNTRENAWQPVASGKPKWFALDAYRVRPEPKREKVTLWAHYQGRDILIGKMDLIDGKPDPDSIRMKGI